MNLKRLHVTSPQVNYYPHPILKKCPWLYYLMIFLYQCDLYDSNENTQDTQNAFMGKWTFFTSLLGYCVIVLAQCSTSFFSKLLPGTCKIYFGSLRTRN